MISAKFVGGRESRRDGVWMRGECKGAEQSQSGEVDNAPSKFKKKVKG